MSPEDEPEAEPDTDPDDEGEPSLAEDLEDEPGLADDLAPDAGDGPSLTEDLDEEPEGAPLADDLEGADDEPPLADDLDEAAEDAPLAEDLEAAEGGGGSVSPNVDVEVEGEAVDAAEGEPEAEDEIDPEEWPTAIYALKTTINQEKTVMKMVKNKCAKNDVPVMATLAPADLRGYILIESTDRPGLERVTRNIPHARGLVDGETELSEVEHFLTPKPAVAGIAEGDIVELTSGPFKGERARVQRIDEGNEEITVELFEAMVPIPVTVRGDHVRVLEKEEESDR